jgi:hypothetical protein
MIDREYKGYRIVSDTEGYKEIRSVGRGAVPLTMRGQFTTEKVARQAIDYHLATKVTKDDKAD